ncbi:cyanophycinase [Hymenobacter lutimineralis]|uniref:Cyanophycinase n=1 Tax=Hymenobacter lutimineralis TaxID=2606448 RepID=A0A5D6V7M3_9BACT|nr:MULTISPECIES: cyanophycinase [Hymenobacter]QIX62618.1 cyanophycinase [Hymenobacter sp. BT18]TYZ11991.1 cyanophycinase [Hymenobacter lutimineralis]
MMRTLFLAALTTGLAACQHTPDLVRPITAATASADATGSLGLVGDAADVTRTTTGGTLLMGGGTDVDAAMRWMLAKAGGGDVVVLRATGTDAYNSYLYGLGSVNSVETLLLNSRTLANDPEVEAKIRGAEAVFIAGGDQANYVNYWKDTKVEEALNYLRNTKQVPIGGTSAGCAIMGATYFSAINGTITSAAALTNPYNSLLTLGRNDFLSQPNLTNTITDTHFNNPDRRGRLLAFLARMSKDYGVVPRGIGVDEQTAVCVEPNGTAKVFGTGTAFFLQQNGSSYTPERCVSGSSLDWYRNKQAVRVYKVVGTSTGTGTYNVSTWSGGTGGSSQYYYASYGTLGVSY